MNKASAHHRRRLRAERRFKYTSMSALLMACTILVVLLYSLLGKGLSGFEIYEMRLAVRYDLSQVGMSSPDDIDFTPPSAFEPLAMASLLELFPDVGEDRESQQALAEIVSGASGDVIREQLVADPNIVGQVRELWMPVSSRAENYLKGRVNVDLAEVDRSVSDQQIVWIESLQKEGRLRSRFNSGFLLKGDSRSAEQAGFKGAIIGSLLTMLVCIGIVFPIGVMTAMWLEEFAPRNKLVDFLEVNINNLAAVPSIVFGLLGLAVFLSLMGMPRSAPVVGGLTLGLMVLPVIIISTRAALRTVPSSIRDGARALGASPMQVVLHHSVPLAMPGIMTGAILAVARAIGETAPLLMIGMVAFVADIPDGFTDSATVMPVQIYLWATSPEQGFVEKTAAGILVLLVLLLAMNALAIYIRKRFETRW